MVERLTKFWPTLIYHQWIQWIDALGTHVCEPDAFVPLVDRVILFEMKLTASAYGLLQLDLYAPLLSAIYSRPVVKVLVCKSLAPGISGPFVDTPGEVDALPPGDATVILTQPR